MGEAIAKTVQFTHIIAVLLSFILAMGSAPLAAFAEASERVPSVGEPAVEVRAAVNGTGLASGSLFDEHDKSKLANEDIVHKAAGYIFSPSSAIYANYEMLIGYSLPEFNKGYERLYGYTIGEDGSEYVDAARFTVFHLGKISDIRKITVASRTHVKNARGFFSCLSYVTSADVSKLDMSECEDMSYMFSGCSKLKTLDMSGWNIDSINATGMFEGCKSLSTVKVGSGFYWNEKLPEYKVNGHSDWYSAKEKRWLTSQEIYSHRDRIADTYTKHAPIVRDISRKGKCSAKVSVQAWTGKKLKPNPTVKWGSKTLKKGRDYKVVSYGTNKNNGRKGNWVKIKGIGSYKGTRKVAFSVKKPRVVYRTRQQSFGDSRWVRDGEASGKIGKSKRVEAFWVGLKNTPSGGNVIYRARVQGKGWMSWKCNGKKSGASGKSKRIEALQIKLSGKMAKKYDVWYRAYAQKFGWTGWARNGAKVGTANYGYRLESIQVKLIPKGHAAPGLTKNPFRDKKHPPMQSFYKFKHDTWSFANYSASFGPDVYADVFGNAIGNELYGICGGGEDGVCYGFAASVGAIRKYRYPSISSFNGARGIHDVAKSRRSSVLGMTAQNFIEHCFVTQFDYRLQEEFYRNLNNYSGLVNAVKQHQKGGTAIVVDFYKPDVCGHTVFPLGIKSDDSRKTVISVYDNNNPSTVETLILFKKLGRYTSFRYSADEYGYYSQISWETPADNVKSLIAGNGIFHYYIETAGSKKKEMNLISTDTDLTVVCGGKTYDLSPNCISSSDDVIPIRVKGGSSNQATAYWVAFDTSDMVVEALEEDATVSVATETGSVEVEAEEGSTLHMTVSDDEANSVSIDGEEGDSFQVTYREDNGGAELEESEISGTATADLVETELTDGGKVDVEGALVA